MSMNKTFKVTSSHIKLLKAMVVSWEDCEFGAPSIDCKRPYGNSDVYVDMAGILGYPLNDDDEVPDRLIEKFDKLHKETETVLQIFLSTGEMKTGIYTSGDYGLTWRKRCLSVHYVITN